MAFRSLHQIRALYRTAQIAESSHLLGSSRNYATGISNVPESYSRTVSSCFYEGSHGSLPWSHGSSMTLRSAMAVELPLFLSDTRSLSTQVKAPAQARQMGALRVAMLSSGFIYEPYTPHEKISFFKRWFTRSGCKRTKEDTIIELKNAYAISKLRKKGYSKNLFYKEAINLYKETLRKAGALCTGYDDLRRSSVFSSFQVYKYSLMANGDKNSLRKAVTEKMFSELKNDQTKRSNME
ncbi:hypothetical protein ACFX2J_033230 [Malus domestica]